VKKRIKTYDHDIELDKMQITNDKFNHCLELRVEGRLDDENGDEVGKIGSAKIFIFDEDWYELLEAADMHSQEASDAMSSLVFDHVIVGEEEFEGFLSGNNVVEFQNAFSSRVKEQEEAYAGRIEVHGRVAVINNFTITKKFRNKGLGVAFMRELLLFLSSRMRVDFSVLKAHPYLSDVPYPDKTDGDRGELTTEQLKVNKEYILKKKMQLSHFYHNHFGFMHTGNSDANHMALDLDKWANLQDNEDAMYSLA
jgi:hypothetical protein